MKKSWSEFIKEILSCIIGMIFLAFTTATILEPSGLVMGGITGTSIISAKAFNVNYAYVFYALSVAILIITYLTIGSKEGHKIIFVSLTLPLFVLFFKSLHLNLAQDDIFLAAVFNGVLTGIGITFILKAGYSTGGTDTLGKIIKIKFLNHMSISNIFATIDILVLIASVFVFSINAALYGIITQYIMLKTINFLMYGKFNSLIKLDIISAEHEEIKNYILKEIGRGATISSVRGAYSDKSFTQLSCILSPRDSIKLKKYIAKIDEKAFVSVTQLSSVWGTAPGFSSIHELE